MEKIFVLHNNRCTKSRNALTVLEENNIDYEVIPYLDGVLSEQDIASLLRKLKLEPLDIVRKSEAIFKENLKGKEFSASEWLTILQKNPKLIERPILYTATKAVVGRPTENVTEFIKTL